MTWKDNIDSKIARLKSDRVIHEAAGGTMLVMAERIWTQGGLTNGGVLTYVGGEMYAYKPPFPRQPSGKGKPYDMWGRPHPKKGTSAKIKGGWYPSYEAAKEAQGRGGFPFELTGDLRKDWLGGSVPTPVDVSELECTINLSEKNAKKAQGLADKKGTFLELTTFEQTDFARRANELWGNILRS